MRKVVRLAGLLVLLGLLGLGALAWFGSRYLAPDQLAALAEEEINSRVQIGSMRLELLGTPARIVLRDVILAPRDAESGKPHAERVPLAGGPVEVEELRLAVSLPALLRRRVEVREFAFENPRLTMTLDEDGRNSLDALLRAPDRPAGERGAPPAPGGESLNVHQQGFLARLEGVRSRGGAVDVVIEKTGLRVRLREVAARLDAIEIDPAALGETNEARLELAARVEISSSRKGHLYALLDLAGPAGVRLFDPSSGDLDPEVSADLALGPESFLNADVPVVRETWKAVRLLEKAGVKIGDLPPRAGFGRSRAITVHYLEHRFTLRKPLSVWFDDWELAAMAGSWIQTETEQHAASTEVLASEKLSGRLRKKLGEGLDSLPKEIRPEVVAVIEDRLFRDGRLVAEVVSAGELSGPKVSLMNTVPDARELVRKAAERFGRGQLDRFAEGLLRKLRGDD